MRIYGLVETHFWTSEQTQNLSPIAKLCAIYLMTGPHTTMLGCFHLPDSYIASDLNLSVETVQQALLELSEIGYVKRDKKWLWVCDFLSVNPIDNPNQAKCVAKLLQQLPVYLSFVEALMEQLAAYVQRFPSQLSETFQELCQSVENDTQTVSKGLTQALAKGFETPDFSIKNLASSNTALSVDNLSMVKCDANHQKTATLVNPPPEPLWKPLRNPSETVSKGFRTQKQKQKQNTEKNQSLSSKLDVTDSNNLFSIKTPAKLDETVLKAQAIEILDFLNQKTAKAYRPVSSNLKLIMACLRSGATTAQCRQVIAKKYRQWGDDAHMAEYLRPATLFNPVKFEQYVGELVLPAGGLS